MQEVETITIEYVERFDGKFPVCARDKHGDIIAEHGAELFNMLDEFEFRCRQNGVMFQYKWVEV